MVSTRTVIAGVMASMLLALPAEHVLAEGKLGSMKCNRIIGGGVNLLIYSKAKVRCTFSGSEGSEQWYEGDTGVALGVDLKWNKSETISFAVLSSTAGFAPEGDFLTGKYGGAKAEAALGIGVGAAVLLGGSNKTTALQPAVSASTGAGAALGLSYLNLRPDPLNQARLVTPHGLLLTQVMYAGYFDRAFGHYHREPADYEGSDYFADRATSAASGIPPKPEEVDAWPLQAEVRAEVVAARERLVAAMSRTEGAAADAAAAQVNYDCWRFGLSHETGAEAAPACKEAFLVHVDRVETAVVEADIATFAMRDGWSMVLFDTDVSDLDPQAALTVQGILKQLALLSEARIHVEGNTDRVGSAEYNQRLAERRAASVMAALEEAGVPSAWITTEAYGEDNPVSVSTNPHDALNRRVDVVVHPLALDDVAVEAATVELRKAQQE